MSTDYLKSEINSLERKVKLLLAEHVKLREDVNAYRAENQQLKERLISQKTQLSSFQNNHKITKIVEHMTGDGGEMVELKEVIDYYIKEIDKCIALLGEA